MERKIEINVRKIILLFLITLFFISEGQAAQSVVSIGDVSVESGNDVIATIMINDITNYGTATIEVTYDPAVAVVTTVESTSDSTVTVANYDNSAGSVIISAWNIAGVSGDVEFAGVKFNAVGSGGSSTPLTLEVNSLIDTSYNNIASTTDDGTLSVIASSDSSNGYDGDNPLTIFSHDTFAGNLTYTTGSSYYSGKLYTNAEYEVTHSVSIPSGATVEFARLYAYWTWSALGSTGRYPDLKLVFDDDELTPDAEYNDSKGFEPYNYPGGTWAYDVTEYITGSGDHETLIVNTGPDGSYFAVSGVGLLVVYSDPDGDEMEYWIAEGCDYLSSQEEAGLTPEESTTETVFSGSIDPTAVEEARLTTVVQSGNDPDDMLMFNSKSWTGIYDGTPYADLDVDEQDVLDHLVYNDNTVKMRAVDDYMAPCNAFLVLRHTLSSEPTPTPAPAGGGTVSLTAYIIPAISIEVTPSSVYFGSLGPGEISANHEVLIKNKGSNTIDVTSEVTDTAQDLYVDGLQINNAGWSVYETRLNPSGTVNADLRLKVPVDYAGVGEKEGKLMFWAQQV
ncbi:MAG: DUF3344 domain-containing protein [Methanosarcinaceae archaeon]|nr:DUF3344 domain-containing protein [Methanosarcinaceae archaeon]